MQSSVSAYRTSRTLLLAAALAMLATLFVVAATSSPVAAQPNGATCFTVADLGGNDQGTADKLLSVTGGVVTEIGDMGTNDAEAFAIRPGDTAYAWSGADGQALVTVDLTNAMTAAAFAVPGPKIEGLTWANVADNDLDNDILYVVRTTGAVQGFTPAGAPAGITANVAIAGFPEGTDIAWDPVDDLLYAIRTDDTANGDMTQVVSIDAAGTVTLVGPSAVDLEGLGFTDDGTMIGTTGDDGGDDLYVVSQADGSVGAALADLSGNVDNEDVDCLNPEFPADPGVLTAVVANECIANAGKITATITYASGAAPADYTVAIAGQADQMGTLAADDQPAMVMSPADLVDGDYAVTVTNTTSGDVLANEAVTIACAADPGSLSASIADDCVADDGEIVVEVNYVSGADPVDYSVTVQGEAPAVGTLNAGDMPAVTTFPGLADGAYNVVITDTTNGDEVGATAVIIACDPTDPPSASAAVECVEGVGEVTVTLFNPTGSVVEFTTTVTGVAETETLNPTPFVVAGDVVINEFMADNETSFADANGDNVDWIELYNPTAAPIDITGWSITDDAAVPDKQVLAGPTTINADGYVYLFRGDGSLAGSGPTFDFNLGAGGEYLGLYDDAGVLVSEYAAEFPDQFADISYGLGSDGSVGYFDPPSLPANSPNGIPVNGIPTSTVPMAMDTIDAPDGITDVIVVANGVQVEVANSPLTIACDTGEVTFDVAPVCVGDDGRILTTITNATQAAVDVTVAFSAGGGPDQTATVAPGETTTLTRTGRADGNYTVTYGIDGEVPTTVPAIVDCDPNMAESPALALQLNVNGDDANAAPGPTITEGAMVNYEFIVTNAGDVPLLNVMVTADSPLLIDCDNGSSTISSLPTNSFVTCTALAMASVGLVTVNATANGASQANTMVSATDPANYTGEAAPAGGDITYTFENSCPGGNGAFYFVVTNGSAAPAEVQLDVGGLSPKIVTVPAGATATIARTGRPDNLYTVSLTINGVSEFSSIETVNCDGSPPPTSGEIGDLVFNDLNADGIKTADEPGLGGVDVNLWTDDDGNGTPDTQIASTTTMATGEYRFTGLDTSKTYIVQFIPAGRSFSPVDQGGNDALDSDAGAGGITGPITLNPGEFDSTVDAGLFESGDVVFEYFNECVGGNGSLYLLVTNNTASSVPVILDVTGLPTKNATVAAGATSFVGRTGRQDGVYQVTAVVDGMTVVNSTETVACDAPPAPTTESIGLALELTDGPTADAAGNFVLEYTYKATNTGAQQVTITSIDKGLGAGYQGATILSQVATMDLCTGSALAVGASCMVTVAVTVDVDNQAGPFLVNGTVMGLAADGDPVSDVSTDGSNVDPGNDGPENDSVPTPASFPGLVTYSLNNTCLSGNGAFIYTINNGTADPVTATLEVAALAPKTATIAPGATINLGISGRQDGIYPVTLSINDAIIDTGDRAVTCDVIFGTGTAVISEPRCSAATETVFVTLEHLGGETDVEFVITVDGVDLAPTVLAPGDPAAIVSLGTLAAGPHMISVAGDGVASVGKMVTIAELDCFTAASVEAVCVDATEGFIRITLDNPTTAAVPYVIMTSDGVTTNTINGVAGIGATGLQVDEATFTDDGTYTVVVSALGVEVFNGMVGLACGTPQLTAEIDVVECELDGRGNVAVTITYLAGDRVATYRVDWDNAGVNGSLERGIASGVRVQPVRLLFDGPHTITVTDTTDGANTVLATEVITINCTEPVLEATLTPVACVSGTGQVAFDITHVFGPSTADYTYSFVSGAQTGSGMGTVSPGATVTEPIGGLADGDVTITVVNTTNGRMDQVAEFTATVMCEDPVLNAMVMFSQCDAGGGDVSVQVSLVAGDGPANYEIEWVTGGVTDSIIGSLAMGSVTRVIEDLANGQVAFTVTNTTGAPVTVDTEVITIVCP